MKKLFFLLLACGLYTDAFTQNDQEPCCGVINIDAIKNIVTVRDKTTGQIYQFKANTADMRGIQMGNDVNVSGGKITSINGAKKAYVAVRPDPLEPCCSVVSIQPDPLEPCCNAVTIKNNSTNNNFSASVPKQIAATIKPGQAVSMNASNNLAVVQSSFGGSNGEMNSYGYPATSGEGTSGNENATEKWVITPVAGMKGVLGTLDIKFPVDVERNILIYQQADNKFLRSVSRNDKTYSISPGEYRFTLTNVPVENVPIQKGHITRLKAGFLNIVSEGDWHLYDETKEKAHTSGNKPKKLPLPVGNYQLKLGGEFYPVTIKDGATEER